ncbi:helix-hairpin-helix domain-containing protein [Marinobacter zhejiangensis]|uniref:Predicted 5' DNA nuclease, flap endonuclease-1-like, helix-3-turn-helix (H3TH) domain n=1 Tax=Marinobacter zhejiangensis TaxID=488535 RepID=A0A1I4RZI8_9GAMM|nr:helix-hairpin-helix domain-containing protein [Marinobacter zhejiangensis]SFM57394.1 Predicted 5' DNA nuclease, flap endonuclease-1-like, helix-3-turn-helix (H3TH) domain [Marinobacter zhejiangensis]
MAKKAKPSVDKIVKKVNKEFEKTSAQVEKLINDALKQFDTLQNQIQDPVKKLLREIDDMREREMKRFHDELERRLGEFQDIQNAVMERLGIAGKAPETAKPVEKVVKSVEKAAGGAKAKPAAPAKKPAAKAAPAKKAPAAAAKKPAAKAAKPVNQNDLTKVKGIGPATAKKMADLGINTIDQIANPSAAEKEKLQAFAKMKGFDQWSGEAKKLL